MQTKYQILDLLQKFNIPYAAKGKSYVTRCPWCKGDSNLKDHNAEINVDTGTIYCFSEQKTYFIRDLLQLFGELNNEDVEKAKEKMQKNAQHNTELARATQKRYKFEDVKNDLIRQGFTVTGIYTYYNLSGEKEYEVVRFEKPQPDGKNEKIPIPVDTDGYVGLGNKRQIPYRLEQFLTIQSDEIWLVEGEKCTDAVIAAMPSSANIVCLGFRKASDFKGYENLFQGKRVTIFEDNDKTGNQNTQNLVEILKPYAKEITIVKFTEFADGYDVADYLEDFGWNQIVERISLSEKITNENDDENIEENFRFMLEFAGKRKIAPEKWLCSELIYENTVSVIDAPGGTGKSFLALQLAVSYIAQESFLLPEFIWRKERNRKVLYLTKKSENPIEIINNRLLHVCDKYEIDPINIIKNMTVMHMKHLFATDPTDLVKSTESFQKLKEKIVMQEIQLVIIDPVADFFLVDMNANERIPYIYEMLEETGATWVLLHHQSKNSQFEKTENTTARGASAIRDKARLRITIKRRETPHKGLVMDLFIDKANFSKYQQHHIFLTPQPPFLMIDPKIWPHEDLIRMEEEFRKRGNEKENKKNGKNINKLDAIETLKEEDYSWQK